MESHSSGGAVLYRVGNAEKRLDSIEKLAVDVPVIRRDIETLVKEVGEIRDELKSSKRATWAVFLAIFGVGMSLVANVLSGGFG